VPARSEEIRLDLAPLVPIAGPPMAPPVNLPPEATRDALAAVLSSLEKIQGMLSREKDEPDAIRALTVEALHRRLAPDAPTLADMMSTGQVEAVRAASAPAPQDQPAGEPSAPVLPGVDAATISADEIHSMFAQHMAKLVTRYEGEMQALTVQRDQALSLITERERSKQTELQARFAALIKEASQLSSPPQ
jgi:hypothetical protein